MTGDLPTLPPMERTRIKVVMTSCRALALQFAELSPESRAAICGESASLASAWAINAIALHAGTRDEPAADLSHGPVGT